MNKNELVAYWVESSNRDFVTMEHLFEKEDYHWALFMGHLVIEKLLKAYYVQNIDKQPPFTHNLLRLAEKSGLLLSENQKDFLVTVTAFNIRARYDDYKLAFYKTCTKPYTTTWIDNIYNYPQIVDHKTGYTKVR